MSAPVKFDENLGLSAVALLRDAGYVVDRVHDQGLSGAADEVVWQRVCAENRFFVTLGKRSTLDADVVRMETLSESTGAA